jgi:hypothetical protein
MSGAGAHHHWLGVPDIQIASKRGFPAAWQGARRRRLFPARLFFSTPSSAPQRPDAGRGEPTYEAMDEDRARDVLERTPLPPGPATGVGECAKFHPPLSPLPGSGSATQLTSTADNTSEKLRGASSSTPRPATTTALSLPARTPSTSTRPLATGLTSATLPNLEQHVAVAPADRSATTPAGSRATSCMDASRADALGQ